MSRADGWILRKLSRVTSSGRFVPEIDGLRFVAILSVVLFHAHPTFLPEHPDFASPVWASLSTLILKGWFGVPLFFAISGFVLALPFAEQRLHGGADVPWKGYYLRRLTRLEPPYLVSMVILTAMLAAGGAELADLLRHALAGIFYVHWFVYHEMNPINRPTWTLEIEVQFYLLAPLLASVFAIRRVALRRAILGAAILAAAAQSVFWPHPFLFRTLPGQLQFFLVGFLLADVHLVGWRDAPPRRGRWDLAGVAAWSAMPALLLLGGAFELLLPVAIFFAYGAAFRGPRFNRLFRSAWIVVLGGMCYTTYLYHVTLIWYVKTATVGDVVPAYDVSNLLRFAIVTAGVLASSAVLFVSFEKPFMRKDWPARARAWFAARRTGAATTAPTDRG